MCRLYGIRSTHYTKIHCELLSVQNSLIGQAEEDSRGYPNPHGWGIGMYRDGKTICRRQEDPAHKSEKYRETSMDTHAETAIAHIRRATVGEPRLENTHPFCTDNSFLAHNGHVDHFEVVGEDIREFLPEQRCDAIEGSTDSEHFFQLVLHEYEDRGADTMHQALQRATKRLRQWVRAAPGEGEGGLGLNILWVYDGQLAGSRLDRTLWMRCRDTDPICPICDQHHADVGDEPYRFIEFASERLTMDDNWEPVPDYSVFWIDDEYEVQFEPMLGV